MKRTFIFDFNSDNAVVELIKFCGIKSNQELEVVFKTYTRAFLEEKEPFSVLQKLSEEKAALIGFLLKFYAQMLEKNSDIDNYVKESVKCSFLIEGLVIMLEEKDKEIENLKKATICSIPITINNN